MTTGVLVPDDVIVEILAKLPVKSLLRFNCVSKTWYSVISDPQFSNSLHRMQPSVLICDSLSEVTTITLESLLKIKDRALTPLSIPWETKPNDRYRKTICLGSCNGLVCVSHPSSSCSTNLIIWNPSTRKFRRLPCPIGHSLSVLYNLWTFVWFGYDESIDDYKVVWLHLSPRKVAVLDVFTLKSNTWRRSSVEHIAVGAYTSVPATGVLSNGAIHWITSDDFSSEKCILVLDLASEKLRVLKFSHAPLDISSRIVSLEGGCLCLCTYAYQDAFPYLGMDFWIMKEYGVDSSWTKLLSIPYKSFHPPYSYVLCPILLSKEGKEMVLICTVSVDYPEGRIVKLRVEEGGKVVKNEETLHALRHSFFGSNVILHMEESLVSISPLPSNVIEESLVSIFSPSSSSRKRKSWRRRLWNFFFSVRRGNNHNLK